MLPQIRRPNYPTLRLSSQRCSTTSPRYTPRYTPASTSTASASAAADETAEYRREDESVCLAFAGLVKPLCPCRFGLDAGGTRRRETRQPPEAAELLSAYRRPAAQLGERCTATKNDRRWRCKLTETSSRDCAGQIYARTTAPLTRKRKWSTARSGSCPAESLFVDECH